MKLLGDRIAISQHAADTKTAGGLYLPETSQNKPLRGIVVSVGGGKRDINGKLIPLDVKVNDEVIFRRSGIEIQIESQKFIIVTEEDILGIIE